MYEMSVSYKTTPSGDTGLNIDEKMRPEENDDSSCPNLEDTPSRTNKPEEILSQYETVKYGLLYGLSLAHSDFDRYLTFYLIADGPGTERFTPCEYFALFAAIYMVANILDSIWTVLTGWMVDALETRMSGVMKLFSVLQVITAFLMLPFHRHSFIIYAVLYNIHMLAVTQMNIGIWKVIKLRIRHAQDKIINNESDIDNLIPGKYDSDIENSTVSGIGNVGDIAADIFEGGSLIGGYILGTYYGFSFNIVMYYLFACSMLLAIIPMFITLGIKKEDVEVAPEVVQSPSSSSSRGGICNLLSLSVAYVMKEFKYFYKTKAVWHACWHAVLVMALYQLVEFPLSFANVSEDDDTSNDSDITMASGRGHHFCGGSLQLILRQGAVLNGMFLFGSLFYNRVLVPMPPRKYYSVMLPSLACVTAACVAMLYIVDAGFIASVLLALGQILPYCMNAYSYYVFTTAMDAHSYGFIMAIYSIACQGIFIAVYFTIADATSQRLLIIICMSIIFIVILYGRGLLKYVTESTWSKPVSALIGDPEELPRPAISGGLDSDMILSSQVPITTA